MGGARERSFSTPTLMPRNPRKRPREGAFCARIRLYACNVDINRSWGLLWEAYNSNTYPPLSYICT